MKKYICFFMCVCFFSVLGQENNKRTFLHHDKEKKSNQIPFRITKLTSNQISGWYNIGYLLDEAGSALSYYRTELFPDSTVMVEYASSWGSPWHHSVGQVFHPTAVWGDWGPGIVDPAAMYTLDTVSIPYRYFRFQDLVEDTLLVQVYPSSSTEYSSQDWGNYIRVFYDYQKNLGLDALYQDTFLLTIEDTAVSQQSYIDMPIGMTVGPDEYFATTMSYRPGNAFGVGDTLDPYSSIPITNPINAFLCYYFVDEDFSSQFENEFSFYHGLTATTSVRYDENPNGWNGKYIAGNAWNSGDYHYDIWFHLTTIDLGEENERKEAMYIYPNPSKKDDVWLSISSVHNEEVLLSVLDIRGKSCLFVSLEINSGISTHFINTSSLKPGLYTFVLEGQNISLIDKIVIY